MKHRVEILPRAQQQLRESAAWWAEHRSPLEASRWLSGIEAVITGLGDDPDRFPLAEESDAFEFALRELNYGVSRHPTHRVLFAVQGNRVLIYAVRHLAQQNLTPEQLD